MVSCFFLEVPPVKAHLSDPAGLVLGHGVHGLASDLVADGVAAAAAAVPTAVAAASARGTSDKGAQGGVASVTDRALETRRQI